MGVSSVSSGSTTLLARNVFIFYNERNYDSALYILMQLFIIPGLWLDNAVIFTVSIPRLKYHEIFLEF